MQQARTTTVENFGGNVRFAPTAFCQPLDEAGLLDILTRHRGEKIRAIGSLHSWSEAPAVQGVLIDVSRLNSVVIEQRDGRAWATIGAGCQIKQILAELNKHELTLPTLGLISEQTIAGAAATGTHGSGKHSLSHYVAEVRVAEYDRESGQAVIRTIREGPELLAARTSLGLFGVVVSIGMWCRPQYMIEEHFSRMQSLEDVLAAEAEYPLQQFFLLPWAWKFLVQHRREVDQSRSRSAWLYRLYWFFGLDIGLHLIVQMLVKVFGGEGVVRSFFRRISPHLAIRNWKVVDRSDAMLIMEHELFRHIEIELFVARARLPSALAYVKEMLRHFTGEEDAISPETLARLRELNLAAELPKLAGTYTHHYVICVRRVLQDDTLISMASDAREDCYAISLISYARPAERAGFFGFANFMARSMAKLFSARPHWGKVCPLDAEELERLYPHLPEFRQICQQHDPQGTFRNAWLDRVLFNSAAPAQNPESIPGSGG